MMDTSPPQFHTDKGAEVLIKHVVKSFRNSRVIEINHHTFLPGTFTAVLGRSGSGKSTLLRLICGLESYDKNPSSVLTIEGKTPAAFSKMSGIGFAFQRPILIPWLSVSKNISITIDHCGKTIPPKNRNTYIETACHYTGIDQTWRHIMPHELSGGMSFRVGLARAIASNPQLLLLDEPFTGLDEKSRNELVLSFREYLRFRGKSVTVIMVTHSFSEAALLADHLLVVRQGYQPKHHEFAGESKHELDASQDPFCSTAHRTRETDARNLV
jgi:ABC-type nitrate/sulfonate/bicarbonate transport system ATPase subunit